jgi:hypothetical protein
MRRPNLDAAGACTATPTPTGLGLGLGDSQTEAGSHKSTHPNSGTRTLTSRAPPTPTTLDDASNSTATGANFSFHGLSLSQSPFPSLVSFPSWINEAAISDGDARPGCDASDRTSNPDRSGSADQTRGIPAQRFYVTGQHEQHAHSPRAMSLLWPVNTSPLWRRGRGQWAR